MLAVTLFGAFVVPFNIGAVNVAAPRIASDLGLGFSEAVWIQLGFLLTVAVLLVPAGRIADTIGRERVYIAGVSLVALGSLLAALAPGGPVLLLAMVVQGFGSAGSGSTSIALVTAAFPPSARGRALGIMITSIYLGLSFGPAVGGLLTTNFGWRSIFVVAIVLGPAVALAAAAFLHRPPVGGRISLDLPGLLLLAAGFGGCLAGLNRATAAGWDDPAVAALLVGGVALLVALVVVEGAREAAGRPVLIQPSIFRERRAFTAGILTAVLNYSSISGVSFLTATYLQVVRGLRPDEAGLTLLSAPVAQTAVSLLAGVLSDRFGARAIVSLGMATISAGLFALSALPAGAGVAAFVPWLTLIGVGHGLFSTPNTSAIMGAVEPRDFGFASGALGTARQIGQSLSLAVLSAVAAFGLPAAVQQAIFARAGGVDPASLTAFADGIHRAFFVAACTCAIGIFTSLVRGGHVPDED